jgi:hypothetical protein
VGGDRAGATFIDLASLGYGAAPKLTTGRGGAAARLSDAELEAAIRHGVRPDGRSLRIMPSATYADLADDDLAALLGFVRQALLDELFYCTAAVLGRDTEEPTQSHSVGDCHRSAPYLVPPLEPGCRAVPTTRSSAAGDTMIFSPIFTGRARIRSTPIRRRNREAAA